MEVVGAVASFIAIAQALKGGQKALTFLRSLPEIEGEWKALNDELEAVGRIIDEARQYRSDENPDCPESDLLCVSINRVEEIANALVTLSQKCSRVSDQSKVLQADTPRFRPKKTKWLWVKDEVRILYIRLRDAKTTLLMAVQLAGNKQVREIPRAVCDIVMPVLEMKLEAATERTVREFARWVDIVGQQAEVTRLARKLEMRKCSTLNQSDSETALATTSGQNTWKSRDHHTRTLCSRPCLCRCHQSLRGTSSRRPRCSSSTCKRAVTAPLVSGTILLGHWLFGCAISLSLAVSLRPRHFISLNDRFYMFGNSQRPTLEFLQQSFEEIHPDDVDEFGDTCFLNVLSGMDMHVETRMVYIEMALRYWGQQLANGIIERTHYYEIQNMLQDEAWPESTRRCLQTMASFSEECAATTSTPIHFTIVEKSSISAVRAAISRNPDFVNTVDEEGQTPIHLVIRYHIDSPRPLLFELSQAGADIHAFSGRGDTPLLEACHQRNWEAVEWLLQQGVDPNKPDAMFGWSPLHVIAKQSPDQESVRIAQLLISKGADCNARRSDRRTPLHCLEPYDLDSISATYSRQLICALVQGGARLEIRDHGTTPLQAAVIQSSLVPALELIDHGADIRSCTLSGCGLLYLAARFCDEVMLVNLREKKVFQGLDPYHKSLAGRTPWDSFIANINIPPEAYTYEMRSSSERCLAYEHLFVQIRGVYLHEELNCMQQAEQCLLRGNVPEARLILDRLVDLREPKAIWSTEANMQTYRSFIIQLKGHNLTDTLESIVEKQEAILEELSTCPWEMDSPCWNELDSESGATFEEWMKQDAIARTWQKQGIRRWRREHPLDWMATWLHPGGCVTEGLFETWEASFESDSDEDGVWSDGGEFT